VIETSVNVYSDREFKEKAEQRGLMYWRTLQIKKLDEWVNWESFGDEI
jgi:hypothetical protein